MSRGRLAAGIDVGTSGVRIAALGAAGKLVADVSWTLIRRRLLGVPLIAAQELQAAVGAARLACGGICAGRCSGGQRSAAFCL